MVKHGLLYRLIIMISLSIPIAFYSQDKPMVCFTFDDGNPEDIMNYNYLQWNQMILNQLNEKQLQAVFYVYGKRLDNEKGHQILGSWDKDGHIIANHTYSHLNYNSDKNEYDLYKKDILRCDTMISRYTNYQKYFRAPFLKYGETREKRDSLNAFLKKIGYQNGYVTIDASDWFFNSRLIQFMKKNPGKSIEGFKKAYVEHLLERAKFYDDLAFELFNRRIKHSILLHHNLTSALFLADLMNAFEKEGWQLIDASEAFADDIYRKTPDILPAGESIVWGLAKETGKYEDKLRYPGEDSVYEEEKLNELEAE